MFPIISTLLTPVLLVNNAILLQRCNLCTCVYNNLLTIFKRVLTIISWHLCTCIYYNLLTIWVHVFTIICCQPVYVHVFTIVCWTFFALDMALSYIEDISRFWYSQAKDISDHYPVEVVIPFTQTSGRTTDQNTAWSPGIRVDTNSHVSDAQLIHSVSNAPSGTQASAYFTIRKLYVNTRWLALLCAFAYKLVEFHFLKLS